MKDCALTAAHVRAGRALLEWSQADLAKRSGVTDRTVRNFEAGRGNAYDGTENALRTALASAGIQFLFDPGPGVQLVNPEGRAVRVIHGPR